MESTRIFIWASRLTMGMIGLTGFVATGLTVISLCVDVCPLELWTSPE
jgi:hypothetical protein